MVVKWSSCLPMIEVLILLIFCKIFRKIKIRLGLAHFLNHNSTRGPSQPNQYLDGEPKTIALCIFYIAFSAQNELQYLMLAYYHMTTFIPQTRERKWVNEREGGARGGVREVRERGKEEREVRERERLVISCIFKVSAESLWKCMVYHQCALCIFDNDLTFL